jgi:hypothetical protein
MAKIKGPFPEENSLLGNEVANLFSFDEPKK